MRRIHGSTRFAPALTLLVLLCGGCASLSRQREVGQQRVALLETAEKVYRQEPVKVWPAVEAHFREQGFRVQVQGVGSEDVRALQTDFKEVTLGPGFAARVRYYAQVQRESPEGSRVRVFRHTVTRSQEWHLLPTQQQLVTEMVDDGPVPGVQPPATAEPRPLDPADKSFGESFYRDLSAEAALRARLEGRAPGHALTGGMPAAGSLVAEVAVALGNSIEPLPEEVRQTRCGPAIPGLDEGSDRALQPGGFLLLGELHGTQEVPRFVGQAVCHAAHAGVPVVLALELPLREQRALDRYMASEGSEEDGAALVAGPFWRRPEQDGRSSRALVALIERARRLNRQGFPVVLMAYDVEGLQGSARDAAMAQQLLARRRLERRSALIVLTGNVHASSERGVPWDKDFVPMGWHLARAGVPFRAYDALYREGSVWDCRLAPQGALRCGVHRTDPARRTARVDGVVRTHFAAGSAAAGGGAPDARPHARESELGPRERISAGPSTKQRLRQRYGRAVRRYGPERFFFLSMAPERYPRGFDGYFYVGAVQASPPAHAKLMQSTRSASL